MSHIVRSTSLVLALAACVLRAAHAQDAPLPTTIITDVMIADIGARNLKDILVTYVPGLTSSQDHNEVNVAMRGVFGSSQQRILVLVDGHVLNMRSYAAANPDYSISVDKIGRIEVLRGPASSVYGNGALAGVIKIFTKTPDGPHESVLTGGVGNFGQRKISALFGATTEKATRVFAWGNVFHSDGETVVIPASQDYSRNPANAQAILDGYRGPASHDAGVTIATQDFRLYVGHRYGKYTEPFSAGGATGESYVYSDYQPANGVEPGLGIGALNIDLSAERDLLGGWKGRGQVYFDKNDSVGHLIADPSQKAHSVVVFREWGGGVAVQASRPYEAGARQGTLVVGGQLDFMRLHDSLLSSGTGGGWTTTGPTGGLLELGNEQTYSGFVRATQPFADKWIGSAGVRGDVKVRRDGDNVHTLSPHLAATYLAGDRTQVTMSYASAFLDAPYFYRFTTLASYRGARTLRPEYLKSFQVSPTHRVNDRVNVAANFFVNSLDDLVWRNKNAGPTDPIYQNAGFLTSWGLESEVAYTAGRVIAHGNITYQRAGEAEKYDVEGGRTHNVPNWTWNAIVTMRPPVLARHDLSVNVTTRYIGSQLSPIGLTIGPRVFSEPDRTVDAVVLVNAGVRFGTLWSTRWLLDARVFNVFDTDYEQGGSVPHPYPQPGRSILLTAGRAF